MSKITIYRIENSQGIGPYHGTVKEWGCEKYIRDTITPCPQRDDIDNFIPGVHKCGFESMEQLENWFPLETRKQLMKLGFFVKRLEVDINDVQLGFYQLVFIDPRQLVANERIAA